MAGYGGQVCLQAWPEYDESKTVAATVQMAVQVGGKVRANIVVPTDSDEAAVVASARGGAQDRTHGGGDGLSQVHRGQGPPGEPDLQAQGVRPIRAERVFINVQIFSGNWS